MLLISDETSARRARVPKDILTYIIIFIDYKTFLNYMLTCKMMNDICKPFKDEKKKRYQIQIIHNNLGLEKQHISKLLKIAESLVSDIKIDRKTFMNFYDDIFTMSIKYEKQTCEWYLKLKKLLDENKQKRLKMVCQYLFRYNPELDS
jgi:hypothetical protein